MLEKAMHYKRHPDFETYDRITIDTVERYKTSGLSGDEWRFSSGRADRRQRHCANGTAIIGIDA